MARSDRHMTIRHRTAWGLYAVILAACSPNSGSLGRHPRGAETASAHSRGLGHEQRKGSETSTGTDEDSLESLERLASSAQVERTWSGQASYYSERLVGHAMASGKPYEASRPYAAHRTLPFGSLIRVVRLSTGKSVVLKVMDRGPFGNQRRIVDVSRVAAEQLDLLRPGVAEVRVELLKLTK